MNLENYGQKTTKGLGFLWKVLKRAVAHFVADDIISRGAALAFFTALSLSPLLVIFLATTGFMGPDLQEQLLIELQGLIGSRAQEMVTVIIENAREHQFAGTFSAVVGMLTLIFSGTRMFMQMQAGFNYIWRVEVKPSHQISIWFKRRGISLLILFAILFLLLISILITAGLNYFLSRGNPLWQWMNFVITLLIYAWLFGLVYRILPDVNLSWRDVLAGALITAVLFDIGRWAIGKYLGVTAVSAAYGTAGSLVVLLLWVYYSSLILYFGMEIIQSYLKQSRRAVKPESHAQWIKIKEASRASMPETDPREADKPENEKDI